MKPCALTIAGSRVKIWPVKYIKCKMFCWVWSFMSQSTAMVKSRQSVYLITLGKFDWADNQYFMHILLLVTDITDNNPSWISGRMRMTVEIISRSISMKVCDRAGIELTTPWSAVRLPTNCTRGPSSILKWVGLWLQPFRIILICFSLETTSYCYEENYR